MDPNLNERLDNIEKMLADNSAILQGLRSSQKNATRMRIVYWVLIIGLTVVSIYFITPYLGQLASVYGVGSNANPAASDGSSTTTTDTSNSTLTKLLNQYEAQQKTAQ